MMEAFQTQCQVFNQLNLLTDSMDDYYKGLKEAYSKNPSLSKVTYQGFGTFQLLTWCWKKIFKGKPLSEVDNVEMMASICRFFVLYSRKVEITYEVK